jgi:hypothetical protein
LFGSHAQLESPSSLESLNAAYAMYASLLEAQPASPCAKAGITAAGNLLAARKLDDAGMKTEVSKLVVDAIKAYPAARIPTELLTGLSSSDVTGPLQPRVLLLEPGGLLQLHRRARAGAERAGRGLEAWSSE